MNTEKAVLWTLAGKCLLTEVIRLSVLMLLSSAVFTTQTQ